MQQSVGSPTVDLNDDGIDDFVLMYGGPADDVGNFWGIVVTMGSLVGAPHSIWIPLRRPPAAPEHFLAVARPVTSKSEGGHHIFAGGDDHFGLVFSLRPSITGGSVNWYTVTDSRVDPAGDLDGDGKGDAIIGIRPMHVGDVQQAAGEQVSVDVVFRPFHDAANAISAYEHCWPVGDIDSDGVPDLSCYRPSAQGVSLEFLTYQIDSFFVSPEKILLNCRLIEHVEPHVDLVSHVGRVLVSCMTESFRWEYPVFSSNLEPASISWRRNDLFAAEAPSTFFDAASGEMIRSACRNFILISPLVATFFTGGARSSAVVIDRRDLCHDMVFSWATRHYSVQNQYLPAAWQRAIAVPHQDQVDLVSQVDGRRLRIASYFFDGSHWRAARQGNL